MWTYLTIFGAIIFWTGAICLGLVRSRFKDSKAPFYLWIFGAVFFIVHIFAAFAEFYQWNHQKALSETARQTEEIFGWNSGIGLYVNYLFLACLLVDIGLQIKWGTAHRFRKAIDFLVIFMIINGAIIFGGTAARIVGSISLILIGISKVRR